MTVSIIICTCNRVEHLRQTLLALGRIRIPPGMQAEVLVVDNGSKDETAAVTRGTTLPNLPVQYCSEPRRGQCHARNTGLARSQSEMILFTDDDVRPPEDWLEGMCEPVLLGKAQAVAGGVRIAPKLQRAWMQALHRGWLASTEGIDPATPYTMFGANMGFSREVLSKVPAFDTELGPGALGFGDEMLFSWQLLEAGYQIQGALDVTVEHHFEAFRLFRSSFLESARKRGRTQAYLDYHWRRKPLQNVVRRYAVSLARLAFWRLRRRKDCQRLEGCAQWEMELTQRAQYFRGWLTEQKRPPNYEPRGLVKQNQMLVTECPTTKNS